MTHPLAALLLLSAVGAAAQGAPVPAGQPTEKARAEAAAAELKKYTDQFRVPGGDPFPAPPPIKTGWTDKEVDANAFGQRADLWDFKSCMSDYRALFDWWEEGEFGDAYKDPACFKQTVHLDPERFQVAYGLNSNGGADPKAGARWVCGFASALRGYFIFYNESVSPKGGRICRELWGIGTGPVDRMRELNDWISKRYKEAARVDLGQGDTNVLNWAKSADCQAKVESEVAKQAPKEAAKKSIPSLMHKPDPEQTFFKADLSDVDFEKYDYWVFYYDASWQPWGVIAAQSKKWKNTPESFKKMVLCRAPVWAGNYVSRVPKNSKYELSYFPKGGVTLRHPLQPNSAKERNQALIKEHHRKYCR